MGFYRTFLISSTQIQFLLVLLSNDVRSLFFIVNLPISKRCVYGQIDKIKYLKIILVLISNEIMKWNIKGKENSNKSSQFSSRANKNIRGQAIASALELPFSSPVYFSELIFLSLCSSSNAVHPQSTGGRLRRPRRHFGVPHGSVPNFDQLLDDWTRRHDYLR